MVYMVMIVMIRINIHNLPINSTILEKVGIYKWKIVI
jgi:hypothetical protein